MNYTDNEPRDRAAKKAFPTPDDLEKLVDEYIESTANKTSMQWVRFANGIEKVERPVSVCIYDFCDFAKIHLDTLRTYREKRNFSAPLSRLDTYIFKKAKELRENGIMPADVYKNVTARAKEYQAEKEQTDNGNAKQIVVTFGAESVQIDNKPVDTSVSGENIDFDDDDDKIIKGITPNRKEKY